MDTSELEITVQEDPVTGVWTFELGDHKVEVEPRHGYVKVDGHLHQLGAVRGLQEVDDLAGEPLEAISRLITPASQGLESAISVPQPKSEPSRPRATPETPTQTKAAGAAEPPSEPQPEIQEPEPAPKEELTRANNIQHERPEQDAARTPARASQKLRTVKQLAQDSPFTEAQIRWWLFNRKKNGLAAAVVKIGRRLYIDQDKFDAWVATQHEAT